MQHGARTIGTSAPLDDSGLFQKLRLMASYGADQPGWPQRERDLQKLTSDAIDAAWSVLSLKKRTPEQTRFAERWCSVLTSAIDAWLPRSETTWDFSKYELNAYHFTGIVQQFLVQQMFAILNDDSMATPLRAAATAAVYLLFMSVAEESPRPYGFEPARLHKLLRADWLPVTVRNLAVLVLNNARELGSRRGEKDLATEAHRLIVELRAQTDALDMQPISVLDISPAKEPEPSTESPKPGSGLHRRSDLDQAREHHQPTAAAASLESAATYRSGKRLIGWHDVLKTIGEQNDQNVRRRIRRYSEQHGGPIKQIGRKVTVDEGELIAWWSSIGERAGIAEVSRKQVASGRKAELKHPLDQHAAGIHTKPRRQSNAGGAAGATGAGP